MKLPLSSFENAIVVTKDNYVFIIHEEARIKKMSSLLDCLIALIISNKKFVFDFFFLFYRICVDQSTEYERQFRSLQLEVKNVQRQLETSNTDRENAIQENRRLQDDLAAVMCEVRNLQHELESSRAESYDLKRQLQTYVSEVRRAEEMLNRKVKIKIDSFVSFKIFKININCFLQSFFDRSIFTGE